MNRKSAAYVVFTLAREAVHALESADSIEALYELCERPDAPSEVVSNDELAGMLNTAKNNFIAASHNLLMAAREFIGSAV